MTIRKQSMRISDAIAEFIIKESAWRGVKVLKPLYRIRSITLGPDGIDVERDYFLKEYEREVIYGAQYDDAIHKHMIKDSDYHLGDLPFSIKDYEEKPIGT